MHKFIIRNIYCAYISKEYNKGAKHAFTRDQNHILTFDSKDKAEQFIKKDMKNYPFDDLEVIKAHF